MAFGNWDEVINIYNEVYLHSKYGENARAMLDLIPKIRNHPRFARVLPGVSHGTLFFRYPNIKTTLEIRFEGGGDYIVYLYHPKKGESGENSDETIVKLEALIPTLQSYLDRLETLGQKRQS